MKSNVSYLFLPGLALLMNSEQPLILLPNVLFTAWSACSSVENFTNLLKQLCKYSTSVSFRRRFILKAKIQIYYTSAVLQTTCISLTWKHQASTCAINTGWLKKSKDSWTKETNSSKKQEASRNINCGQNTKNTKAQKTEWWKKLEKPNLNMKRSWSNKWGMPQIVMTKYGGN